MSLASSSEKSDMELSEEEERSSWGGASGVYVETVQLHFNFVDVMCIVNCAITVCFVNCGMAVCIVNCAVAMCFLNCAGEAYFVICADAVQTK